MLGNLKELKRMEEKGGRVVRRAVKDRLRPQGQKEGERKENKETKSALKG